MNATDWATLIAFISLVIFLGILVYLKVPGMVAKALDERAKSIEDQLAEAARLREEAQALLTEYQRKRKEAEAEAEHIVAVAKREASLLAEDAKRKTEEYVARRNQLSETKIKQAESDAISAVRSAAVDLAVAAAQKLAAEKSTGATGDALFQDAVNEVRNRMN